MRTEIVEIGFVYRAAFVMPKKRKPEAGLFRSSAPIVIAALDDGEAPVVCRIRWPKARTTPGLVERDVRFSDGRFWEPMEDRRGVPLRLERLRELARLSADEAWDDNPFLEIADPHFEAPPPYLRAHSVGAWAAGQSTVEEAGVRELHSSRVDDALRRLNAAADGFRAIEGVVHRECREPRLWVALANSHLQFEVLTSQEPAEGWIAEDFRPDRIGEARRFAAFLIRDQGIERDFIDRCPLIETPRPDLLSRDDFLDTTRRSGLVLMRLLSPLAFHLPDEGLEAFAAMRRAARALVGDAGTRTDATAFMEALVTVCASLERIKDARGEFDALPYGKIDGFLNAARMPIERWIRVEGGPAPRLGPDEESALAALEAVGRMAP